MHCDIVLEQYSIDVTQTSWRQPIVVFYDFSYVHYLD